jgi:hypothetical protein
MQIPAEHFGSVIVLAADAAAQMDGAVGATRAAGKLKAN